MIYLKSSVGIGEHPQHIDEVDKQIEKIATAEEKMKILHSKDWLQILNQGQNLIMRHNQKNDN